MVDENTVIRGLPRYLIGLLTIVFACFGFYPGNAQSAGPSAASVLCASAPDHYRSTAELYQDLDDIAAQHADIAAVVDYGDSYLKTTTGGSSGYDLKALRITNPLVSGRKPGFFF